IVKRVWTSSYTLYSGGLGILILAGFLALIEWNRWRRWAVPLVGVGVNSISPYLMSLALSRVFWDALDRHLGWMVARMAGPTIQPVLHGFAVVLIFWFILFWMYRRKIFLRI